MKDALPGPKDVVSSRVHPSLHISAWSQRREHLRNTNLFWWISSRRAALLPAPLPLTDSPTRHNTVPPLLSTLLLPS